MNIETSFTNSVPDMGTGEVLHYTCKSVNIHVYTYTCIPEISAGGDKSGGSPDNCSQ